VEEWHKRIKLRHGGADEGDGDNDEPTDGAADVDDTAGNDGAVEMAERQSNNPLVRPSAATPINGGVAALGNDDALARLGAQMQAQQAQISVLLEQQAKVMEAIGVITSELSQSKRDKTSRETVA